MSSRQIFEWTKLTVPATLTDIQRAARFLYLQKLAFGGRVDGQSFGTATTSRPRFNLLRLEEDLSDAWLRLSQAHVEHLPWNDCVHRYDRPPMPWAAFAAGELGGWGGVYHGPFPRTVEHLVTAWFELHESGATGAARL